MHILPRGTQQALQRHCPDKAGFCTHFYAHFCSHVSAHVCTKSACMSACTSAHVSASSAMHMSMHMFAHVSSTHAHTSTFSESSLGCTHVLPEAEHTWSQLLAGKAPSSHLGDNRAVGARVGMTIGVVATSAPWQGQRRRWFLSTGRCEHGAGGSPPRQLFLSLMWELWMYGAPQATHLP